MERDGRDALSTASVWKLSAPPLRSTWTSVSARLRDRRSPAHRLTAVVDAPRRDVSDVDDVALAEVVMVSTLR
jgi:hypothetical protein